MKDRYVILTGAKNNAGDFLIKYRAKQLLRAFRSDRDLIEFDAWKPLDDDQLETINASQALLLTGGPALQEKMYPSIYPLVEDVGRITVPIITMAIGWKGRIGSWEESYHYPLDNRTISLLQRIESAGYLSSVRDYHTLGALWNQGFKNFLMTGCAALYSLEHVGQSFLSSEAPRRVSFSLGVSFFKSKRLAEVNRRLILALREAFADADFTVAFHHSTEPEVYRRSYGRSTRLLGAQVELVHWLEQEGISWIDVSGSAEAMLDFYLACDFHIGYRVHAHILMASISRPTVLIAEDGRGIALREVLGGMIMDGCFRALPGLLGKVAARLGYTGKSLMNSPSLPLDLVRQLKYEQENGYPRISRQKQAIDVHFPLMKKFLEQLP